MGLEELPRGERRETVMRGARGWRRWQEIVLSGCIGEFGFEQLPHGERRGIVVRGGGEEAARHEIAFSGTRASLGSESCRGASAGILFCVGCEGGGGGGGGQGGAMRLG